MKARWMAAAVSDTVAEESRTGGSRSVINDVKEQATIVGNGTALMVTNPNSVAIARVKRRVWSY